MSGVQVLRIEVFIVNTNLTSMQQSLAWTNILHLCHLSKTVFLKVRSDCAFCNRYDCEDVFAHEMFVTLFTSGVYDRVYCGIPGLLCKRSVWGISHMQNRILMLAGQDRELK